MKLRTQITAAGILVLALGAAGWGAAGWFAWPHPGAVAPAPPKSKFADWAAIVVAGDWRAHSGAPSDVFDNARRDLVKKFIALGFDPGNIRQFSTVPLKFPYQGIEQADEPHITEGLAAVTAKARGGCLLYFTSHGSPEGILIGDRVVDPAPIAAKVNEYCGDRPTVVIVSACFSGIFVPMLEGHNRAVFTAARADRTSFGCGEQDQYTFYDTCMLAELGQAVSFPDLAGKVRACVEAREAAMNADAVKKHMPPDLASEPQFAIDPEIADAMNWK